MKHSTARTPLIATLGATLLLGASASAYSMENPFSAQVLDQGYQLASKNTEGSCGEGKCGNDKMKADKEGSCGEGKCGADKPKMKKMEDGKCGEGKCGNKS